jgi:hypothetical protein
LELCSDQIGDICVRPLMWQSLSRRRDNYSVFQGGAPAVGIVIFNVISLAPSRPP